MSGPVFPHADDEAPEARGAAADPQLGAAERQHEQQWRQDVDPEVGDHHDGEHVHLGTMVIVVTVTGLLTVLSQVAAPRSTPATQTVPVTSQHSSNRMYTAISGHEGGWWHVTLGAGGLDSKHLLVSL